MPAVPVAVARVSPFKKRERSFEVGGRGLDGIQVLDVLIEFRETRCPICQKS